MTDLIKDCSASRALVRTNVWRDGLTGAVVAVLRVTGTLVASVFLLAGLILLPLPIPLGLPLLALGGFLMWQSCPPVRGHAIAWLRAHPGVTRRGRAALARFRLRRKDPGNRDL